MRKDLSYLGSYGTRGVGYDVEYLSFQMSRELGLTHDWPVVIVGAGNLGQALANYGGFRQRGFPVAALLDASREKVGGYIRGVPVHHMDDLPGLAADLGIAAEAVNVKGKTNERLGFEGRGEGIAAHAVVLLVRADQS